MFIDDGKGKGNIAEVNKENQLLTKSIVEPLYAHISADDSNLFAWNSAYSATADDIVFYILNTDPNNYLRINEIIVSSAVTQLWTLSRVTEGTAAGTAITEINHNFASGKTAQATAKGDAAVTGLTAFTDMKKVYSSANESFKFELKGSLLLPVNTAISIKANTTGAVAITMCGFFETLE